MVTLISLTFYCLVVFTLFGHYNRPARFCNRMQVKKTNHSNALYRLKVNVDGDSVGQFFFGSMEIFPPSKMNGIWRGKYLLWPGLSKLSDTSPGSHTLLGYIFNDVLAQAVYAHPWLSLGSICIQICSFIGHVNLIVCFVSACKRLLLTFRHDTHNPLFLCFAK